MNKKDIGLKNEHGIRRGDVFYGVMCGFGPCEWIVYAVGGRAVCFHPRTRSGVSPGGYASAATPEWVKANMRRTRKGK